MDITNLRLPFPMTKAEHEEDKKLNEKIKLYGPNDAQLGIWFMASRRKAEEKAATLKDISQSDIEKIFPKKQEEISENSEIKFDKSKLLKPELEPSQQAENSKNPHPNSGKKTTGNNGYSMVVQDDGSYKYYNDKGDEISAETFRGTNPSMYSQSLTQNWTRQEDGTHWKRGDKTISDYSYNMLKSYGDPAGYKQVGEDKYVNSKGEVINKCIYDQLVKAYDEFTK